MRRSLPVVLAVALSGCLSGPSDTGDWQADPATPVDALWIHGLSSDDSGYDETTLKPGIDAFDDWGWPGGQVLVAYHGCDHAAEQVWADGHGDHDTRRGGPDAHAGTCGGHDSNTPIEHIAYHIAWLIHERYTARQRCVALVAHSMGGLVVEAMMHDLVAHHPDLPDDVCIRATVHFGAPLYGARIADLCDAVYDELQCQQMSPGSPLIADTFQGGLPSDRWGARTAHITSEFDAFVPVRSSYDPAADLAVSFASDERILHGGPTGYFERNTSDHPAGTWKIDGAFFVSDATDSPLRVAYGFLTGAMPTWPGTPNQAPAIEDVEPADHEVNATGRLDVEVECTADPDGHPVYAVFRLESDDAVYERDLPGFSPSHTFEFEEAGRYKASVDCADDYGGVQRHVWQVQVT